MAEHAWTLENLAAYVAGGLEPAERDRLERHAGECADCSRALADAYVADGQLMALFADVRPGPMLEDHMIRTLRKSRRPARRRISTVWIKASLAVAALALLAVLGAGITALIDNDWMPDFAERNEKSKESGGQSYPRKFARSHQGANWTTEESDPFLAEDINPALTQLATDLQYMAERKADVSVPGSVNPDETVGIMNGDMKVPPPEKKRLDGSKDA